MTKINEIFKLNEVKSYYNKSARIVEILATAKLEKYIRFE